MDENDTRSGRIDGPEVAGQAGAGELGDSAGELDAGRAATEDDESLPGQARDRVVGGLGLLEGDQQAAAHGGGVRH